MSTVKTDVITALSTNGALDLSGAGTGGVEVSDYLVLSKGSDIASATALTLGKDGNAFDVTGTTTITSIATQGIGSYVTLHFDGALTFTHHSTDLILPGAANITTAAGDIAVMHEYASGDWRCASYTKASGKPITLQQTKGSDIVSATSLTLGTDGNLFDVTGTTTITSIATQGVGSYVTLHFDGVLTFTHHSTDLILPGAANITTAAGDIAVMYEYASADWRCVSYTKASGAAVVAGGGAWNIIGTDDASDDATLDVTGLDGTYDTYAIVISGLIPATDNSYPFFRFGDSSGVDSGASDYNWFGRSLAEASSPAEVTLGDVSDSEIQMIYRAGGGDQVGNAVTEGFSAVLFFDRANVASFARIVGQGFYSSGNAEKHTLWITGLRLAAITVDRVQVLFNSGNVTTGRLTVWGLAHA